MANFPKRDKFGFKINNQGRPEKWTPGKVDELAEDFMKYLEKCFNENETPFVNQFAIISGFYPHKYPDMCAMSEKFKEAYDLCKNLQELQIVRFGLNRKNDSSFSKFVLTCNHGWKTNEQRDKEEEMKSSFEEYLNFVKKYNAETLISETDTSSEGK